MHNSQQPAEVRILKYLLTMEHPEERLNALHEAFSPGPEIAAGEIDMLHT